MNPGKPLYFLNGTSHLFFPFPFPLVPAATRQTVAAPRALTISTLPNVLPPPGICFWILFHSSSILSETEKALERAFDYF